MKNLSTSTACRGNELYIETTEEMFSGLCVYLNSQKGLRLRLMFGSDEREAGRDFRVYAVFSGPPVDEFYIVSLPVAEERASFPSITMKIPAAHWYEREIRDMLGIIPEGHPDPRRLVFHDAFPSDVFPLRRDARFNEKDLLEWGAGIARKVPYEFVRVGGEGVHEIPVGPVHAGIIEPGHFRFSVVGESIFFLEPRLFYKHKGIEKQFEKLGFEKGVALSERVSGTSSFSHSAAYCMAVERMSGAEISEKAMAVRTVLTEMERLYNHIGDIGNVCAGTSLQVGYAKGAVIKETLMRLHARVTGSRYLRGVNVPGGVSRDIFGHSDEMLGEIDFAVREMKEMMELFEETVSHMERVDATGILSKDIALGLGASGIAAKASGVADDLRMNHPHLLYHKTVLEPSLSAVGDVAARVKVRAEEAECSAAIIQAVMEASHEGPLSVKIPAPDAFASALGYAEGPRGSIFYFVKAAKDGTPLRVKLRSPSYCNWPTVPYAVHGNIVPDFPLCNKSFNLSYSGSDM